MFVKAYNLWSKCRNLFSNYKKVDFTLSSQIMLILHNEKSCFLILNRTGCSLASGT